MNVIICARGSGIGGMEVFFSGFARFVIKKGYNLFFLTEKGKNTIYQKLLVDVCDSIKWIYGVDNNFLYKSELQRKKQRKDVLSQIGNIDYSNTVALAGYYHDFLSLCSIFGPIKSVRMQLIWPHPLDWTRFLSKNKNNYYLEKKRSRHFNFQKKLLSYMDKSNASYYTSYAIFDYNNWYYDARLKQRHIEGLPIQINDSFTFNYNYDDLKKTLRVLWVGRFVYFKNDAIVYISNCLNKLKEKYESYHIIFNIVGHGTLECEEDVKKRINKDKIEVNFLGTVSPDRLNELFSNNDIGIAMGVTVKQMGYAGLPSIIIDSLNEKYKSTKICNWVFDIKTGDDGDGMYYYLMSKPLNERVELFDLLSSILDEPRLLNIYSEKCKKFVEENYSYENQNTEILNRALNSSFVAYDEKLFKYNCFKRFMKSVYNKIKK